MTDLRPISGLRLENFKAFLDQEVPLRPLTLLTGLNGMGKSTVQHALLLLRQAALSDSADEGRLPLQGEYFNAGVAQDLLNRAAVEDEIRLTLDVGDSSLLWRLAYDAPDADVLNGACPQDDACALFQKRRFDYLKAERAGPRVMLETSHEMVEVRQELGSDGRYTVPFIARWGDELEVSPELRHPDSANATLLKQAEAWLTHLSPGTRLSMKSYPELRRVALRYEFAEGRARTDAFSPVHVGFGLSYTLPVLISVLKARPGSLVLLENPEAHVHPRGQFEIGRLLTKAARSGVQVIVESHSDHLLNGIRVSIAEDEGLDPAEIAVHYFSRETRDDRIEHRMQQLHIDRRGRIDDWPPGFFDEWDAALDRLLDV